MAHQPLDHRALDAAVAAGVIDAVTRERLVGFADDWRAGAATSDEEQFRLITGFNDIFVAIAIAIFLFAVGGLAGMAMGDLVRSTLASAAATAGVAWLLAEYFTRRRRMALPSIQLLVTFVFASAIATACLTLLLTNGAPTAVAETTRVDAAWGTAATFERADLPPAVLLATLAGGVLAAVLHWRRYRVPITLAAGCFAAILPLLAVVSQAAGPVATQIAAFICGIAVFLLAMRFDSGDIARVTRRTDIAFWLHLLAAPLIVHPVLWQLASPNNPTTALIAGIATVAIYLALAFVALAVDRRALLVSGLVYVMVALGRLVSAGVDPSIGVTVTALIVGGTLLLLAAFWQRARRQVLVLVSDELKALVPPAT